MCVVFYTYIGYPLIITILSRIWQKPQSSFAATIPHVTLLIAAYNEQDVINEKLKNSLALDYPFDKLQILVAADGSDDCTPEIVKEYESKRVELSYRPQRKGKMSAINRAMTKARGKIVVFSDANNMYAPDALNKLVLPFGDLNVGAVSGAKHIVRGDGVLGESEGMYWRYESFVKKQETRLGSCTAVAGEIFAIRRDLFEAPPQHIINDDFYMAMQVLRRGFRVVYTSEARSFERTSMSAEDEIARRARIIAGRYQAMAYAHKFLSLRNPLVAWQVISHKFLRPFVPFAMIGLIITNILAVIMQIDSDVSSLLQLTLPYNWIFLFLQITFYGLALIGRRVETRGLLGKLLYLPTFLVNSNAAALIGLYRFITGTQSVLWHRVRREDEEPPEFYFDTNSKPDRTDKVKPQ